MTSARTALAMVNNIIAVTAPSIFIKSIKAIYKSFTPPTATVINIQYITVEE